MTHSPLPAAMLVIAAAVLSFFLFSSTGSADLQASWLAGVFYQAGQFDQIYPHDTDVYTMLPPPAWYPYLAEQGNTHAAFPFVYPPLWAHLFAWLTTWTDFDHVAAVAYVLNPVLLSLTLLLAWRTSGVQMPAAGFLLTGLLIFFLTTLGVVALVQNQPQILVGFLIVLAIERDRSGAPVSAGVALALAAALKLYPAIFAIFWLATGRRRATLSFIIAGAGLGGLSVALAGWPLHEMFLKEVGIINGTVLVTGYSFSIDPVLGQFFFSDQMQFVPADPYAEDGGAQNGWLVMAKPPLWSWLSTMGMVAVIAGCAWGLRHFSGRGGCILLWPLAMTCYALVSPLSWGYHYIPAVAFAPVLLDRFGVARGALVLLVIFAPLIVPFALTYSWTGVVEHPAQLVGTVCMAAYAATLAYAVTHRLRA